MCALFSGEGKDLRRSHTCHRPSLSRMKDDYVVRRQSPEPGEGLPLPVDRRPGECTGTGREGKEDAVFLFFGAHYSLWPPLTTADEKGIRRYPMEPCALLQCTYIPQRKMRRRRVRSLANGRAGGRGGLSSACFGSSFLFFCSGVAPVNRRSFINLSYLAHAPQGCARVRKSSFVWRKGVFDPLFFDPPVN